MFTLPLLQLFFGEHVLALNGLEDGADHPRQQRSDLISGRPDQTRVKLGFDPGQIGSGRVFGRAAVQDDFQLRDFIFPDIGKHQVRKTERTGERVVVNATDPLNLVGVVVPGATVPAIRTRHVTYVDGVAEDTPAEARAAS